VASGVLERIRAARDAWLAAAAAQRSTMAASESEAQRREVVRLWLEYVELANPVCARKIRRLLKYEIDATKTADELSTTAVPLGRSIPRPEELRDAPLGYPSTNGSNPAMR
jgi:hypothetical protein